MREWIRALSPRYGEVKSLTWLVCYGGCMAVVAAGEIPI